MLALVSLAVAQILRMTLAASGLSRREIALRADLRPSRLERILGGYVAPSRDEYTMIVRACGCADVLGNYPVAGAARGLPAGTVTLPARTVFGLLLAERRAHRDVDTRACMLSVDYLSLSFDAPTDALLVIARAAGRPAHRKRQTYRWEYRCGDVSRELPGVLVQHGALQGDGRSAFRHRRRNSRLAFNPALASREDWSVVRRVLFLASRVRITRLDVAVDLPGRYQLLADSRKLRLVVVGPQGVETFYIGVRKSDRQIRVYDKRRQMIETGRVDESHPETTRVEVQLRNLKLTADGERRAMNVSSLPHLQDPFAKIALVDLASGIPFPLQLCARWADAFGAQALRPLVTPSEFAVVLKHLPTIDGAHPSRVFDGQWPSAASELLRNLGIT